jgi:sugar lactone lactonase YvrE
MSEFEQWTVDKPWLDIRCSLGEGPFYEKETNSVRFVDIKKKQLHTVSVTEGQSSLKSLEFDVAVTVTCDIEGVDPQDRILIGLKHGLALLDRKTGNYDIIAEFKQPRDERLRSNDGAADPLGNFWLGTMSDFGYDLQPEGKSGLPIHSRPLNRVSWPNLFRVSDQDMDGRRKSRGSLTCRRLPALLYLWYLEGGC